MTFPKLVICNIVLFFSASYCIAEGEREWSDKSGHYTVKAELLAYNSKKIVLQKTNKELVSLEIKDLSDADRQFISKIRSGEHRFAPPNAEKTWAMQSGLKVKGKIIEFVRREVRVELEGNDIFVNDQQFKNLPAVYQKMVPEIVGYFEKKKIEDEASLKRFLRSSPFGEKKYQCEGVLFELPNGDRYGIPIFFFSKLDLQALKPAWERWVAASNNRERQEQESMYLRAQSHSSGTDSEVARLRQIAELKLQLQAYDAGLFDLWEVQLTPVNNYGHWLSVVVPGRNSDQAAAAALAKYPGTRVGAIAKVRRRR